MARRLLFACALLLAALACARAVDFGACLTEGKDGGCTETTIDNCERSKGMMILGGKCKRLTNSREAAIGRKGMELLAAGQGNCFAGQYGEDQERMCLVQFPEGGLSDDVLAKSDAAVLRITLGAVVGRGSIYVKEVEESWEEGPSGNIEEVDMNRPGVGIDRRFVEDGKDVEWKTGPDGPPTYGRVIGTLKLESDGGDMVGVQVDRDAMVARLAKGNKLGGIAIEFVPESDGTPANIEIRERGVEVFMVEATAGGCCTERGCVADQLEEECRAVKGTWLGARSDCSKACPLVSELECFKDEVPKLEPLAHRYEMPVAALEGTIAYYDDMRIGKVTTSIHSDYPDIETWGVNGNPGPVLLEMSACNKVLDSRLQAACPYHTINVCNSLEDYIGTPYDCLQTAQLYSASPRVRMKLIGLGEQQVFEADDGKRLISYEECAKLKIRTPFIGSHAVGAILNDADELAGNSIAHGLAGMWIAKEAVLPRSVQLPRSEFPIVFTSITLEGDRDSAKLVTPGATKDLLFEPASILANGKLCGFRVLPIAKHFVPVVNLAHFPLNLQLVNEKGNKLPFHIISNEAGFLPEAVAVENLELASGEGRGLVIDLDVYDGSLGGESVFVQHLNKKTGIAENIMSFVTERGGEFNGPISREFPKSELLKKYEQEIGIRPAQLMEYVEAATKDEKQIIMISEGTKDCGTVTTIGTPGGECITITLSDIKNVWQLWNTKDEAQVVYMDSKALIARKYIGELVEKSLEPVGIVSAAAKEERGFRSSFRVEPGQVLELVQGFGDRDLEVLHDRKVYSMPRLTDLGFKTKVCITHGQCNKDGICSHYEDAIKCPDDCTEVSGSFCGNGLCEAADGETCSNCPKDCATTAARVCCGSASKCDSDCKLQTKTCTEEVVETVLCGDGKCEGQEDPENCPVDCHPTGGVPSPPVPGGPDVPNQPCYMGGNGASGPSHHCKGRG